MLDEFWTSRLISILAPNPVMYTLLTAKDVEVAVEEEAVVDVMVEAVVVDVMVEAEAVAVAVVVEETILTFLMLIILQKIGTSSLMSNSREFEI